MRNSEEDWMNQLRGQARRAVLLALLFSTSACDTSDSPDNNPDEQQDGGTQGDAAADASDDAGTGERGTHVMVEYTASCFGRLCEYPPGDYEAAGAVELTQHEFGTGFTCTIDNSKINVKYRRASEICDNGTDRFRLEIGGTDYLGPGTYETSKDTYFSPPVSFTGRFAEGTTNQGGDDLSCQGVRFDPPLDSWSCTIVVDRHDDVVASGTFQCDGRRRLEQRTASSTWIANQNVTIAGQYWINQPDCEE